jgi:hypothetical protein
MSETTSIPTTKPPEKFSASDSIVCREGIVGLLVRGVIVTAVIAVATAAMVAAHNWELAFGSLSVRVLISIAVVVWFAMMLGLVFSEYPRGDQAAMSRVGLATFCRTGIPLLVVLVAVNYATRLNSVAICVGILYAVGLVSSLALEISRLGFPLMRRQTG